MKSKRGLLILIFVALAFVSIASVSAADANDTALAVDDQSDDLAEIETQDDVISSNTTDDEVNVNEEDVISSSDENDLIDEYEGWGTFTELQSLVTSQSSVHLDKCYRYVEGDPTEIVINSAIEIFGDATNTIIDGQGVARAFHIKSDGVKFNGLYIRNVFAQDGAAIYCPDHKDLKVASSVFESCKVTGNGGAIYVGGSNFEIANGVGEVRFWKCNAEGTGGAIYLASGATGASLWGKFQDCYSSEDRAYTSKKGSIHNETAYTDSGCTFTGTTLQEVTLTSSSKTVLYGLTDEVEATLKYSNGTAFTGVNLTVTFNGKTENYTTDKNGTISIKIPVLDVGEHTVKIEYIDDVVYTSKTVSPTVTVIQTNSSVTINPIPDINFGDKVVIGFNVENRTNVSAKIIGEYSTIILNNISGNSIDLGALPIGKYNITIFNNGTVNINGSSASANFTVVKSATQIESPDINATYGSTIKIVATLKDAKGKAIAGKNLTIEFNGETYSNLTDSNGQITLVISQALAPKAYTAKIKFAGDANYTESAKDVTVNITKDTPVISADAVTTNYNTNKDLVITLKDSQGNALSGYSITVDLNGAKAYTTDKNGQVKIAVGSLVPKTYTAKITFKGNDNYTDAAKDVKVTVNKLKSKITAKNKKFKKSKKTKKYQITLKDANKKAIKKVKVYLKVKGKTYKATTNNKGKATFKINKLKKKGKHKATITFKGNSYYKKATKKVKITVK